MSKKKPEITQDKMNEELTGYIHRTDLRLIALQETLCDYFKFNKKQKAHFNKIVEKQYKIFLQISMEKVEDENPALAARLLDGQNPYSNLE